MNSVLRILMVMVLMMEQMQVGIKLMFFAHGEITTYLLSTLA